ncbi:MAG: ImmA/IrrE family metallo-endopeptidase [Bacteroidetes bacterium]|nr:ImmA/IrrE family metallo-endopeptidase [Bacteroidota bacterium]MBU1677535.1 ImmA/IrrE family metallo-endopeptidase [Bacteroidota bacterium]
MADKAYITAKVFKWARESAKMTEEIAAYKIAVSVDKLRDWETGESFPTIRQAQNLAKAYKRPFALFFLPDIPNDFQPLQDFRKTGSKELSTSSVFIIREIQQKQAWISEINEDNNENTAPFVGRFSLKDNPIKVAQDILDTLNINPLNYKTNYPILEWIDKAESNGVFISRTSFIHSRLKLDSSEIQGFAIADNYAPFVFINSDDWNAPQLFTLVHELAHIWIAETGISNDLEPSIKNAEDYNPVELFCNEVAANSLMPKEYIESLDKKAFVNAKEVFKNAKLIGVSSFALLVRALNLNLLSLNSYKKLKIETDHEYNEFLKREAEKKARQKEKKKSGGPNYFLLQLNRNSRLFTQTVLDAFRGGYIEPTQASNLLNVKVNKFPKLEAQMYR